MEYVQVHQPSFQDWIKISVLLQYMHCKNVTFPFAEQSFGAVVHTSSNELIINFKNISCLMISLS